MAAPRASDDPLTQAHYAAQLGLLLALRRALKALWPSLDLGNLKDSLPRYATKVAALVQHYSAANVAISADYYERSRLRVGIRFGFTVPHIEPPSVESIEQSVRGALDPLWQPTGSVLDYNEAIASAQGRVEENVEKIAADAGRNELIEAIENDRYARGFARVARPGACSFCLLLASRGAVYKTAESAGQISASSIWPDAKGFVNRYHVGCRCTIQPLFGPAYEAPVHVRDALALYIESTKNVNGSKAKQAAFRKALYEQRKQQTSAA